MPSEAPQKTILLYGDSNTWGYVPGGNGKRFAPHVRWPGVLARLLGPGFRVVDEALCGRTTAITDPFAPLGVDRNGLRLLGATLESHAPLDLVVVMLGTNDLKLHFSASTMVIATGVERLITTIANNPAFGPAGSGQAPAVLVICPPPILERTAFGDQFQNGHEKSLRLRQAFAAMGAKTGVPILYAEDFVHSDRADGIHLSADSHDILGQEVAKWVQEWFGGQA